MRLSHDDDARSFVCVLCIIALQTITPAHAAHTHTHFHVVIIPLNFTVHTRALCITILCYFCSALTYL